MLKGKAGRLVLGHSGLGGLRACCWAVRLVACHGERPPHHHLHSTLSGRLLTARSEEGVVSVDVMCFVKRRNSFV